MKGRKTALVVDLARSLRAQWLTLGLYPTIAAAAVGIAVAIARHTPIILGSRSQELQLEVAMAASAAIFLTGFWVEGYRTATDRVIISLSRTLGRELSELMPDDCSGSAEVTAGLLADAHRSAEVIGWEAAAVPLVAGVLGLPLTHVLVVACLAACYQLFLLSRHRHSLEVLALASTGDLAYEARILGKRLSFHPTFMQRLGLLLGVWAPHFEADPIPHNSGRRKSKRQQR